MYTEYYVRVSLNRHTTPKRNCTARKIIAMILAIILSCITFLIPVFASSINTSYKTVQNEENLITTNSKTEISPVKNSSEYLYYDVPIADTGFKAYMSYKAITDKSSKQWMLQQDAWTDEYGFRRLGSFYMVAMGTYYSDECGAKFHITMESGYEFDVIMGDVKADIHTDDLHQHRNGNVIEFIVDTNSISQACRVMGDMSYSNEMFAGKIAEIRSYNSID